MAANRFRVLNPEIGFTSDVIRDPERFVGRSSLLRDSLRAVRATNALVTVFGKRGVGKSSLMRQIQNMATGDLSILQRAGLSHLVQGDEPRYFTVFYTCDSNIKNAEQLFSRICSDLDEADGLLRLVPHKGKELEEFSRSGEASGGLDLKILKWSGKAAEQQRYKSAIEADVFQTFRNMVSSAVDNQNKMFSRRRGIMIFIDEFDVIEDKSGIGSLMKAMSSERLKFAISGIGEDVSSLVADHASVERMIEQGYAHVEPMEKKEVEQIFSVAEGRYKNEVVFEKGVVEKVSQYSEGYPYFAQLIGKSCIEMRNELGAINVTDEVFEKVLDEIRNGRAFPTLEARYRKAVGESDGRATILTLLAEQKAELNDGSGSVSLKNIRATAQELDVEHVDQLVPRLVDKKYGPALIKREEARGTYEFVDPVLRAYVKLRR